MMSYKNMVVLVILLLMSFFNIRVVHSDRVPAMFVFGDSLADSGNNNYLRTYAKSNYFPYGIDLSSGPTGRFSNGRTFVDMLGEMVGLASPPVFADPNTAGARLLGGVNYASGAAGILDETGQHYGPRFTLSQQVLNFQNTLGQIRAMMVGRNLTDYLSKSLVVLMFGSNDYINNYLMPSIYASSRTYSPQAYGNLLLTRYATQIMALYNMGLRRFYIANVAPLGCIPNQRATGEAPIGRCVDRVNQLLGPFNQGLKSLVDQLNQRRLGAVFVYGNTYTGLGDILNNPATYGFSVIDRGCCAVANQGQITCLPNGYPCLNRNQHVFWDAFHPTQAVNAILIRRAFYGAPSDAYPINIDQLTRT